MGKAEVIKQLRQISGLSTDTDREFWKCPDFPSGVARGIVAELLGNARTEWLIQLFMANPDTYILWCERESQVLPTALHQRGVNLKRIKFLLSAEDLHQPMRLALESKHYPFVVAPNRLTDVAGYQRLHLLAEKSKSTVFLLGDKAFSQAWPISLQLEINRSHEGKFEISVQRQKHGRQS